MDARLKTVYLEIQRFYVRSHTVQPRIHLDIGSDHGLLLKKLLENEVVDCGIAVEKTRPPLENSRRALDGLPAEVRLGNGLNSVLPGEATSLSMAGIGGRTIARVLNQYPERIPPLVVLQPNNAHDEVRRWAATSGYHIKNESLTERLFVILSFDRSERVGENGSSPDDPAYQGLERSSAEQFGPLLLRRRCPILLARLREEEVYLQRLPSLCAKTRHRLTLIRNALKTMDSSLPR